MDAARFEVDYAAMSPVERKQAAVKLTAEVEELRRELNDYERMSADARERNGLTCGAGTAALMSRIRTELALSERQLRRLMECK